MADRIFWRYPNVAAIRSKMSVARNGSLKWFNIVENGC